MSLFQIKICGITHPKDAEFVEGLSSKCKLAIGLNFFKAGKRYVDPETVADWKTKSGDWVSTKSVQVIGVFVNEDMDSILGITEQLKLDGIQLHGDEKSELASSLRQRISKETSIIRAVRTTGKKANLEATQSEIDDWTSAGVSAILLDASKPGAYGGTGTKLDWQSVGELNIPVPWVLAGGLDSSNVAEAVSIAKPNAVDVASGVEKAPGEKDSTTVAAFVRNSNEAFTQLRS